MNLMPLLASFMHGSFPRLLSRVQMTERNQKLWPLYRGMAKLQTRQNVTVKQTSDGISLFSAFSLDLLCNLNLQHLRISSFVLKPTCDPATMVWLFGLSLIIGLSRLHPDLSQALDFATPKPSSLLLLGKNLKKYNRIPCLFLLYF